MTWRLSYLDYDLLRRLLSAHAREGGARIINAFVELSYLNSRVIG